MAKDPARRPGSASIVSRALEKILSQNVLYLAAKKPRGGPWRARVRFYLLLCFLLLLGFGLGRLFSHLKEELAAASARIDHAREVIREGLIAIQAGDLETALKKEAELSKLEGSQSEWDLLGQEIATFQKAVRAARAQKPAATQRK